MQTEAEKLITKARANIFLDHGFFGHMLAKHSIQFTDRIPTLAVDNNRNIFINPAFVCKFANDNKQLQWALCHEVMHPVLNHLTRRGARDPKQWNYAGDAVINDLLNSTGVGRRIEGCVDMPGSRTKTTEQIYNELGIPDPSNPSEPDRYDTGLGDDLIEGKMTESERAQSEAQMRADVAESAMSAKVRGHLSGQLRAFIDKLLESDIAWYDKLHDFMQGLQRHDYSWARPNRRYISQGHYLPSTGTTPKMGEMVIQVDISGSVRHDEMQHFGGHVKRIMEDCHPSKIHILYTDTKVLRHDEFESADEVEFHFMSGGGTDMTAGFKYCTKHNIEPDVFVTLTDGECSWGDQQSFPVIWCASRADVQPTHGVFIPFKIKE